MKCGIITRINYNQNSIKLDNIKEFTFSKQILGGSEEGNLSAKKLRRIRRKQREKDKKQQEILSRERQGKVDRELTPKQLRRIRKKQREKDKKQEQETVDNSLT